VSRSGLAAVGLGVALALAGAGCGGGGGTARIRPAQTSPSFAGAATLPDSVAVDFSLRDAYGRSLRLSAERGRVVLLTFLYTRCRDVCPIVAEKLNEVLRALPSRQAVRVIAVSVDPGGDTPAAVRAYARLHHLLPQFRYLVGSRRALAPVWQNYNVLATVRNADVVDHSAPTLLIDRSGRPRVYYTSDFVPAAVLHDVRLLLSRAPA
jgi:protein SCO1/2